MLSMSLGCAIRPKKKVSDRNFGCYGNNMFRSVISDVSGTEITKKSPQRGIAHKSECGGLWVTVMKEVLLILVKGFQ